MPAQTYSNPHCDGAPTAEGNGPGQLGSLGRCSPGSDLFMFDDPSKFVVGSCVDGDVLVAVHDDPQCADPIQKYEYLSESCQAFCSLATPPDPAHGTTPSPPHWRSLPHKVHRLHSPSPTPLAPALLALSLSQPLRRTRSQSSTSTIASVHPRSLCGSMATAAYGAMC